MPKIGANTDSSFLIDDIPKQRGAYDFLPPTGGTSDPYLTLIFVNSRGVKEVLTQGLLSEWTKQDDSPFTDINDFYSYIEPFFFRKLGGGSGTPYDVSNNFGFIDYNDNTGDVSLIADTWTDVPNDGSGAFSNSSYKPDGVNDVMDTSTGYLDFSDLTLGSEIQVRNDFSINPTTNNALLQVRYILGQGAGEYPLLFWSERLDNGSGIDYPRVITFPIYMGDLNTQGGVGKLQVKLSTSGTLNNNGSYISITLR